MTSPISGPCRWRRLQEEPLIDIRDLRAEYGLDVLPSPRQNINDPLVRYLVLTLWDGRCFWCNTALFQIERDIKSSKDDSLALPPVYELDHFLPRNHGGADSVMNFVPACRACNGSRLDNTHASTGKVERWCKAQEFLAEHPSLRELRAFSDASIPAGSYPGAESNAFFTLSMRRCLRHGLHAKGSWELETCVVEGIKEQRANGHRWPGGREIALAFASRSEDIFHAIKESTRRATTPMNDSEIGSAILTLARRLGDPDTALTYLTSHIVDEDTIAQLDCVIDMRPGAVAHVAHKRSLDLINKADRHDIAELQNDLKECLGFQWEGLSRLWIENRWPTFLLWDYSEVFKNASTRARTPFINNLRQFGRHDVAALDAHLSQQWRAIR